MNDEETIAKFGREKGRKVIASQFYYVSLLELVEALLDEREGDSSAMNGLLDRRKAAMKNVDAREKRRDEWEKRRVEGRGK